jgi:hypothetical protein
MNRYETGREDRFRPCPHVLENLSATPANVKQPPVN